MMKCLLATGALKNLEIVVTLNELLKSYNFNPTETEQFKLWLRLEVSKMVDAADCRHITITTFDQARVMGVKHAINRYIFEEWNLD